MLKAYSAHICLSEIRQKVFRPARKHGYSDVSLNTLIEQAGEDAEGNNIALEIISILEDKFNEILEDNNVLEDTDY